MKIVKYSGAIVDYDAAKLKKSLSKSGASEVVVDRILNTIQNELYEGIATKKIYKRAFSLLKKESHSNAARYNLKEAIRLLGPEGFFFEKYIARLFASMDYEVKSNKTLQGKCVTHEIDVLVKKNNSVEMIECKFHLGKEVTSNVKVPMYILSRFNDLKQNPHTVFSGKEYLSKCWIITNNRFTKDAIDFAECSKLKLMSWNYPEGKNLKTLNDTNSLYPVTCLTTLALAEKNRLLILDIILVREVMNNREVLEKIGISPNRIKNVFKEASDLCTYN